MAPMTVNKLQVPEAVGNDSKSDDVKPPAQKPPPSSGHSVQKAGKDSVLGDRGFTREDLSRLLGQYNTPPAPDPATVKYEQEVAARNAILAENEQIRAHNKPIETEIEGYEAEIRDIEALMLHVDFSDQHFSWSEIEKLASRSTTVRAAAQWLRAHWDDMSKNIWGDVSGGALNEWMEARKTKIKELKKQLVELKPVPPEPVRPGTPNSTQSGATGGGTQGTGSTNGTGSTGGTTGSAPPKTAEQLDAETFANYLKVPAFSTNATTAEGRTLDAVDHLQKSLDALDADLTQASLEGNQGKIAKIQAKMQKLQAGMSALMQMLKQREEMQSNMAKMFSEMAMSAIRNMK